MVNLYQLSFGTVAGVCAGVFIKKGAKAVAFFVGGVFVLLQVSQMRENPLTSPPDAFTLVLQFAVPDPDRLGWCRRQVRKSLLHCPGEWCQAATYYLILVDVARRFLDGRFPAQSIFPSWSCIGL